VADAELLDEAVRANRLEGNDFCPEGGAARAAIREPCRRGIISRREAIVAFNMEAGG